MTPDPDHAMQEGFGELRALMRTAFGAPLSYIAIFEEAGEAVFWARLWAHLQTPCLWRGPAARAAVQRLRMMDAHSPVRPDPAPEAPVPTESESRTIAAVECAMAAPIHDAQGLLIGLVMVSAPERDHFQPSQFCLLESCAAVARREFDLHRMAMRDHLTGALSRRSFEAAARREFDQFRQHGRPCTLVLFDLDHFKRLNDRFGHAFGDLVLAGVSAMCLSAQPREHVLGRVGGEEFALLLPETDLPRALIVAQRLRQDIAAMQILPERGAIVTASFGVAALSPRFASLADWMSACDTALYAAKDAGRNRVRAVGCDRYGTEWQPVADKWNHGGTQGHAGRSSAAGTSPAPSASA